MKILFINTAAGKSFFIVSIFKFDCDLTGFTSPSLIFKERYLLLVVAAAKFQVSASSDINISF